MSEKTLKDFQKEEAIKCYNKTWDYIDQTDRSNEDELEMIHCAHASRYLWGEVGEPINFERGEWQISKVYYLVNNGERALYHASACLEICNANNIQGFDISFAYEAMANAYKLLGEKEQLEKYKALAFDSLKNIEDQGDREYTESELKKI